MPTVTQKKGFASSLAELGPVSGEGLIDPILARGAKSGYVFFLSAGPPDSEGRITQFTIVVRPQKYLNGSPSFYMDESGIKRFTVDNRAATVDDPMVQ